MNIDIDDNVMGNILEYFDKIYDFIERCSNNGNSVMISSNQAKSRAPSILIAYLIKKYNLTFDEALEKIKNLKVDIEPNEGFIIKLKALDKKLKHNVEFLYKCS